MLDPKTLRENPEVVRKALDARGANVLLLDKFSAADKKWRAATHEIEELKAKKNAASQEVPKLKAAKKDATKLLADMKQLSEEIASREKALSSIEKELYDVIYFIPNIPHASVPAGKDASHNKEVRRWGEMPSFSFTPKPHDELGEKLGILNFAQGAKIGGSRFTVYKGLGAKLEMALINFMLDVHTCENGYEMVLPPFMTTRDCMIGTGQLPEIRGGAL